jgi:hypothetical protein
MAAIRRFRVVGARGEAQLRQRPSYPAKAGYPARRVFSIPSRTLWNTGSPAFAGDPGGICISILATRCARALQIIRPKKSRGRSATPRGEQGRPGARCTRDLACKSGRRKRTRAYRFSGGSPAFPAQWFYGFLRALLGDRPSCHRRPQEACSPGTWRQHRGARTTRLRRPQSITLVSRGDHVHRIPPRVRDDREPPLLPGGMAYGRRDLGQNNSGIFSSSVLDPALV